MMAVSAGRVAVCPMVAPRPSLAVFPGVMGVVAGPYVLMRMSGSGPARMMAVVGAPLVVPLGMVHGVSLRRMLSRGIDGR